MNSLIIALAFLSSAVAFVPSAPLPKAAARMGAAAPKMALIDELPGSLPPFGTFDPANLSEDIPDSLLYWYRAAELKHGRVAMLACAGWMVQGSGNLLPGDISYGTSFASLGTKPIEAWAAIPDLGKIQILVSIGLMEFHSEMAGDIKVHYTKGGPMPGNTNDRWPYSGDPLGMSRTMTPAELLVRQNRELQNGRLAMIGAMGFSAAATIPGSIPLLKGVGIFA